MTFDYMQFLEDDALSGYGYTNIFDSLPTDVFPQLEQLIYPSPTVTEKNIAVSSPVETLFDSFMNEALSILAENDKDSKDSNFLHTPIKSGPREKLTTPFLGQAEERICSPSTLFSSPSTPDFAEPQSSLLSDALYTLSPASSAASILSSEDALSLDFVDFLSKEFSLATPEDMDILIKTAEWVFSEYADQKPSNVPITAQPLPLSNQLPPTGPMQIPGENVMHFPYDPQNRPAIGRPIRLVPPPGTFHIVHHEAPLAPAPPPPPPPPVMVPEPPKVKEEPVEPPVVKTSTKRQRKSPTNAPRTKTKAPFNCDYCGFSFKRNHDLKRHIYSRHMEKSFACKSPSCGLMFSRHDNMMTHYNSIHRKRVKSK
ncbi:hypothetical protein HK098_003700 [Nowakowskiella sp. JEL0407]|nr:hypothetical protein HK098_003700 [Nowakowskiella sp. JEL0407]